MSNQVDGGSEQTSLARIALDCVEARGKQRGKSPDRVSDKDLEWLAKGGGYGGGPHTAAALSAAELRTKRVEEALTHAALLELAAATESWREMVLDYDASDDHRGERWDAIRVQLDVALRELTSTLRILAT